ncbi:MAG: recombinase RecF [Planctomycetota bacterium]|nr:MAG: recombinase RecF [Planctomycetota bacterium]
MPIRWLSIRGYRSVQRVRLELGQVNVLVGPNGCGKTNLYRSLFLLNQAADGRLASTLAAEGGMPSCLWAGEFRKGVPKRVTIEVGFDQWSYRFACGLAQPHGSAFSLDPIVREEQLEFRGHARRTTVFQRKNGSAQLRDEQGRPIDFPMELTDSESILSELREPHRFPELSALRSVLLSWRFYHEFRTDADSPLRRPQIAVRTPVLSHDGVDLAAALQTIGEIGRGMELQQAVADAFPGASLYIAMGQAGMEVQLEREEFRRRFAARELSDGTLKYLCLLAALYTPRPPALLAMNEPDANLHPQLFEPLARLIARAGQDSQLWITTHSQPLAESLRREADAKLIQLEMLDGATTVSGEPDGEDGEADEDESDN